MSTAYTPPIVETIPEPQDRDHVMVNEQEVRTEEAGQEESRVPHATERSCSIKEHAWTGKDHPSGSPQLHHFLKHRPQSGLGELCKSSGVPVAKPKLCRHASAEFDCSKGLKEDLDVVLDANSDCQTARRRSETWQQKRQRLSSSSVLPGLTSLATSSNSKCSGSSSGSGSTIREASPALFKFGSKAQEATSKSPATADQYWTASTPDALAYLDADEPTVTEPSIKQRVTDAVSWPSLGTPAANTKDSPTARSSSSASSMSSSPHSEASSAKTADTELSANLDRSIDGDETPVAPIVPDSVEESLRAAINTGRFRPQTADTDRYGTPEMPRGPANLPHIPASVLTPRAPNQGHVKYLPRAEKLPLSGYELLASRISAASPHPPSSFLASSTAPPRPDVSRRSSFASTSSAPNFAAEGGTAIKPIYRRFEALQHRMLLHLQDELSELEEQLHRLDTTDTQTRRLHTRILPASRRAEFLAGGELQWHKTDILGKIGFKLGQYNHVLSSFTATRDLPAPSISDVNEYRDYLATHQPISEIETRFLDPLDDLVTLAAPDSSSSGCSTSSSVGDACGAPHAVAQSYLEALNGSLVTPIPGTMHGNSWRARQNRGQSGSLSSHDNIGPSRPTFPRRRSTSEIIGTRPAPSGSLTPEIQDKIPTPSVLLTNADTRPPQVPGLPAPSLFHVAMAMAVSVLVPILTFSVIPGFVGRMTVVLLVGLSAVGSVVQSGGGVIKGESGSSKDLLLSIAVYAGVMAAVAGVIV